MAKEEKLQMTKVQQFKCFEQVETYVCTHVPMIHCLTNHITINDCANMVLAIGGKPMMAEHLQEVEAVTRHAGALAVNLGNITDERMQAMLLSGQVAHRHGIPSIIDSVGVASSPLRLEFAKNFIATCRPSVIKGNMSEIKALAGYDTTAKGIDVSGEDGITEETVVVYRHMVEDLAKTVGAVIVATGVLDIVSDGNTTYIVSNGCADLAKVTGTGCMLNVIIATYISSKHILEGALLGVLMMGVAGEVAVTPKGIGTFKVNLFDALSTQTVKSIEEKIKVKVVKEDGI